jgi:hypothetical protein
MTYTVSFNTDGVADVNITANAIRFVEGAVVFHGDDDVILGIFPVAEIESIVKQ